MWLVVWRSRLEIHVLLHLECNVIVKRTSVQPNCRCSVTVYSFLLRPWKFQFNWNRWVSKSGQALQFWQINNTDHILSQFNIFIDSSELRNKNLPVARGCRNKILSSWGTWIRKKNFLMFMCHLREREDAQGLLSWSSFFERGNDLFWQYLKSCWKLIDFWFI